MIRASDFVEATVAHGFKMWTGVPCSYLQPLINYVIDSPALSYVGAANEGDAAGIAAGADLGGKRSVLMFQNSGLGNAVNPLTSLHMIFEIPTLVIATLRGEPGGAPDEPQHDLMGRITTRLVDLMRIPWEYFPTAPEQIQGVLGRATAHMNEHRTPYVLVMKKGSVEDYELRATPVARSSFVQLGAAPWSTRNGDRPTRRDALAAVLGATRPTDVLVATTGFIGRELYALGDRPSHFYMVGSMGCAGPLGLGLAWAQPRRRVIVLDGDGAVLMRMGALATLGFERPKNLLHVVLDNEAHDSTGGQATVSHSVDLAAVAAACGYPSVVRADTAAAVGSRIAARQEELTLVHVKTRADGGKDLPRPKETPIEVQRRLRAWLAGSP
jgi:phosphonopyruvate decarboxylase